MDTGKSVADEQRVAAVQAIEEARTEGLFVRKSSGLVREIGPRETFGVGVGIILLTSIFINYASGLATSTGGDYGIPILIGGAISIAVVLTYAQLMAAMPRSGGDYVYASRIAGPVLGAAIGGLVMLAMMLNAGNAAIAWGQLLMPFFFATAGSALHIHALTTFSTTVATKTGFFLTGSIFIIAVCCLATRPIRVTTRIVFWAVVVTFIGFAVICAELLFHSRADFIASFNRASSSNAYALILSHAHAAGLHTGATLGGMFAVYAWAYLCFGGFTLGVLAGGEIKRPARTYVPAMLAALALGVVCALVGWLALRHLAGLSFLQAAPWLSNNQPATYSHLTSLNPLLGGIAYAGVVAGDPVTKLVIPIGLAAGLFAITLAYVVLTSRVIFALAFDRLLPTRMADVSRRTHAPLWALGLTMVGTLAFNALGSYTSLLTIFRNLVLILFSLYTFSSLMGMLLPYRRPELFASAPKIVNRKWLGIPAASVIAAVAFVGNGIAAIVIGTKPSINGGYSVASVATIVFIVLSGLVLYFISRTYFRRRGLDINMAMHELPPE
jgi:basic amino acid/polyamine antiporter, APA family